MKKWEYKRLVSYMNIDSLRSDNLSDLNALGNEGWELISIVVLNGHIVTILKREIELMGD